ncbi:MAG: AAA family ATPase [Firmicutes bacterium]|nr:AAA family ATPase [Bacillota bacterium]
MIIHICGNFCTGKTTAAEILRRRLGWPVVPIGRVRQALRHELMAWAAAKRLWDAWDRPEPAPGRSGIWVSTGLNWREAVAWGLRPEWPWVFRVRLTAPERVLLDRQARRAAAGFEDGGYWPYAEGTGWLLRSLAVYDRGEVPFPLPVDLTVGTEALPPEAVAEAALDAWRAWCRRRGIIVPPAGDGPV